MIQIGKNYYTWKPEKLNQLFQRILNGDEITINSKRKEAYINYYIGDNTEYIPYDYADMLDKLCVIECHSGNFETGEKHYVINKDKYGVYV